MERSDPVQTVKGIGSSTAERLTDKHGIETVGDLADVEADVLAGMQGFSEERAKKTHERAVEGVDVVTVPDEEDDESNDPFGLSEAETDDEEWSEADASLEDDIEEMLDEADVDEDEEAASESTDDEEVDETAGEPPELKTAELQLRVDRQIATHVLHVVLEEVEMQERRRNQRLRDIGYRLFDTLVEQLTADGFDATVELDEDQLQSLHRALSQGASEYRSSTGFNSIYPTLLDVKDDVTALRRDLE